jgi:DNA-binding transcriptional ArsR family regulator
MRNLETRQSDFLVPWDRILGVKSQVRALRVLERTREPMSVRELARRAQVQLRAMQLATDRLREAGVVESVGTGTRRQVRLRREHPLTAAVEALFAAERGRVERVLGALRPAARSLEGVQASWLEDAEAPTARRGEGRFTVGVLAPAGKVDSAVDQLRSRLQDLMKREDLAIEVRGWTTADLEAMGAGNRARIEAAIPLAGALPPAAGSGPPPRRQPRTHASADADLLRRGGRAAEAIARRPELVDRAREEVARRLESARPPEARTLREWQQILDGLSPRRLQRFLADPGERATRLRQSMPVVLIKAGESASRRGRKEAE